MSELYNKIEQMCKEKGINVSQMCRETGINRSTLSELRVGRSKSLSAKNAQKIAAFFGVPVSVLVDDSIATKVDNILNSIGEKDEEGNIVIDYKKIAPAEVPTRAEAKLKYKDLTEEDYRLLDMFAEFLISRHDKSGAGGSEQV